MLCKKTVLFLLIFILSACSESDDVVGGTVSDGYVSSTTALYFPSGIGVDFGRKSISDKVIEGANSKVRMVGYKFDEDYEVIDGQLTALLAASGYVRTEILPKHKDRIVDIQYYDGSSKIMAYYQEIVEGLEKQRLLVLYWRQ